MNNVISFPKKNVRISKENEPSSIDEIIENMDNIRKFHAQETIENIIPILFDQLTVAGFIPEEEQTELITKDSALVVEAIRSLLYKVRGIDHPLQTIAENFFIKNKENDLEVNDKVKIIIKQIKKKD